MVLSRSGYRETCVMIAQALSSSEKRSEPTLLQQRPGDALSGRRLSADKGRALNRNALHQRQRGLCMQCVLKSVFNICATIIPEKTSP